ncbi:sugar epimerase [Exiguobacterium sp. KRL4]|uniref:SDR family oxidoreductase n=1 Tax=Exiguobacterium sp. KRL4 TaxID=1914536 RepID=UPI0008F8883B|nr:SDR family oxidoreductase [Exiguobacterium sp. KRL4]OIN66952.1 sugar epimerase [Exiguobacterium sp. KRL4]
MSNVFIIGANGKVGRQVAKQLNGSAHDVRVGLRSPEQFADFETLGATPILLDLEQDVSALTDAINGSDVVIFTAGSGGHTGADKTILIDLDGAAKSIAAAEHIQAKQFIMVSALNADSPETWSDSMKPYYVAKHYADRLLRDSSLAYTILRPGGLTDDAGTGAVTTDPASTDKTTIAREDVARVVIASIEQESAYRQTIPLLEGTTPIADIFA